MCVNDFLHIANACKLTKKVNILTKLDLELSNQHKKYSLLLQFKNVLNTSIILPIKSPTLYFSKHTFQASFFRQV